MKTAVQASLPLPLPALLAVLGLCLLPSLARSQDDQPLDIDSFEIPEAQLPTCFGFRDVEQPQALAICDALNLNQNVKARELSEQWLRSEPDSPAAQFALAEVLFSIEGNMPRALFHLNRAEELTGYESLEQAFNSGNLQWHYLTLSQLSYVHQLMGDQIRSLEYLDKINQIYGQDVESFRGWPLIKLKQYESARQSANQVLENSDSPRERARALNTLCAVELASLQPIESMSACDQAASADETAAGQFNDYDTVYLTNASEVSLSLLRMDEAEAYLDRATRYLNPNSVADPWIYMLYLKMNQSRFDEARSALDRMMLWREQQEPIVSVMNRAEHFLVSAGFLLLAGYAEDAVILSRTALNQPDRNGSYSADDEQKDSYAALLNMMANETAYQVALENSATLGFGAALAARLSAQSYRLDAWRASRRAASLFADFDVLQNRLRPYAPLDVHIPEWIEPELIRVIGTGVMSDILEKALGNGAFQLNTGYYHAYRTEIAALEGNGTQIIQHGAAALSELPEQEALLRARVSARLASAYWQGNDYGQALSYYETAYSLDPSIFRRLGVSIPVTLTDDSTTFSNTVADYLLRSPRFRDDANGLVLDIRSGPDLSACLKSREGSNLSCYTMAAAASQGSEWNAGELARLFQTRTFGLGYDISKAQRSILLGSSVILSSQLNRNLQQPGDAVLER